MKMLDEIKPSLISNHRLCHSEERYRKKNHFNRDIQEKNLYRAYERKRFRNKPTYRISG
jgi:hypothetical protein